MKKKLFALCVIAISLSTKGQSIKALTVGDKMVMNATLSMFNAPTPTGELSKFKGKAIIIDFWATTCAPCVSSLPELDVYKKKYANDLEILSVTSEPKAAIQVFASRIQSVKGISISTVVDDSLLNMLFPHTTIPHCVWIGKDNVIKAITGSEELTDLNIQKLISGQNLALPIKEKDIEVDNTSTTNMASLNLENELEIVDGIKENPAIESFSSIMRWRKNGHGHAGFTGPNSNVLSVGNLMITSLYSVAYGDGNLTKYWTNNKVNTLDSARFFPEYVLGKGKAIGDKMGEWARFPGRTFCYVGKVSINESQKFPDRIAACNLMKKTLSEAFPFIKAEVIDVPSQDVYVLHKLNDHEESFVSKNTGEFKVERTPFYLIVNGAPIGRVVNEIKFNFQGMEGGALEVINETGYKGNIDLDLQVDMRDPIQVDKALNKYGLTLTKEKRTKKILVLTDTRTAAQVKADNDRFKAEANQQVN